jgi:hypothetical protein
VNARGGTIGYSLYDPGTNLSLANGSFTDPVGGTWVTRTLDAVATSSQIGVRIQGISAQQAGMGLDNVRLNAVTVPETTSLAMLSTCLLLGSTVVGRRRTSREK